MSENCGRQAAFPAILTIGLEGPGGGQSDEAAPVFLAFERYLDASDAVDASLARLAMVIVQVFLETVLQSAFCNIRHLAQLDH